MIKTNLVLHIVNCIARHRISLGPLFLSFGLISLMAHADITEETYPQKINFHNIMQNQDIVLGEVEAITQDHAGFIWLGGRNALLRYDGYEFLNVPLAINPQDLSQTSSVTQVSDLLEDKYHNLWIATRGGLFKYDRAHELALPVLDSQGSALFRESINALAENSDGNLLVASSNGLTSFNTKTFAIKVEAHFEGAGIRRSSTAVNSILLDNRHLLWLGLDEGLLRIDLSTKKQTLIVLDLTNAKSTAINSVKTLAVDHSGDIWAGTDKGIFRLNPTTGISRRYQHDEKDPFSLADDITRQIYVDSQGWVWAASDQGGISLYDPTKDRFLRFTHQKGATGSLSSNAVRRVYEDNTGDLWVGTYPSGVNFYDRSAAAISVYKKDSDLNQGLLEDNVEAVEQDKAGNLWIGAGGVTRINSATESFTHYRHTSGKDSRISTNSILNGVIDSDGEIRFGSWGHGIEVYNPKTDRFDEVPVDSTLTKSGKKNSNKLNDQMVWNVYEDKQKNIWINTHFNGITKLDKKTGTYTFYSADATDPSSISHNITWSAFEDSQGHFWVGSASGLNLMNREKGTFKHYYPDTNDPRSLANGSVLSIAEDHKNRIWFGTDAGLHLYHPETDDFTNFNTKKNGFANQTIRAILEDPKGNLWLGTNNGVVMYNPDTKLVRNYTRYNGELIGGIATGAAVATRKGEMVFGSRNGLYIFNTNKLMTNEKMPPVVLTDFRIFTQKVAIDGADKILTRSITQTEQITLDYTKSMIAFSFAALNYRDPEKNQYAYQLEGFDDKWREVGNQRSALYTNLPAGKYQFRVKASNNDGIWNTQGRSISLTILPPPWKTWWAYTVYISLSISLLLFLVLQQHKKVLEERKRSSELEIKVADRTAELRYKNEELEQAYVQLEAISLSDPLTGLSNRRYLQKLMPMDIAKVQREYENKFSNRIPKKPSLDLTFFILDVDHFKSVNDTFGHAAGDHLLIQLSELLTHICRESDCVVRWGGEEFLIVSRFADRDEAPLMAERIRTSVEQHHFDLHDGTYLRKTVSIGFACFPFLPDKPMALPWEQVIDIADHALYAAKKSGRNRSVGLAANTNTLEDMLYNRISNNLKELIDNNELSVISKVSTDLQWS
jgi:diguanylate cyclase (GGDEF)-like protein